MGICLDSALNEQYELVQNLVEPSSQRIFFREKPFQNLTHLAKQITPATLILKGVIGYETMYETPSFQMQSDDSSYRPLGSAFLISSDGLVLTNYHVVAKARKVDAVFNASKKTFAAKIVGIDPETDLALLRIKGENFPFLTLGDSDQAEAGERVFSIGNPLGMKDLLTLGVLSGKSQDLGPWDGCYYPYFTECFVSDAASNPGNSGGPLLNFQGEVVGINAAGIGDSGLSLSIPSNTAKFVVGQLLEKGFVERSYLGAQLEYLDEETADVLGFGDKGGIFVLDIEKDSPADQSGLQKGDFLLKVNGESFEDVREFYRKIATETLPKDTLLVTLIRNGRTVILPIILGSEARREGVSSELMGELGVFVDNLNAETAQFYGYDFGQRGVMISKIEIGSPAYNSGLFPSCIITGAVLGANTHLQIQSIEDLEDVLKRTASQSILVLQVREPDRAAQKLVAIRFIP